MAACAVFLTAPGTTGAGGGATGGTGGVTDAAADATGAAADATGGVGVGVDGIAVGVAGRERFSFGFALLAVRLALTSSRCGGVGWRWR